MFTGFVHGLLFYGNPSTLVIFPPWPGRHDTKSSAGLMGALSKGTFRGLQLQEAEAVGCSSLPLLPSQLGGFQFCVADLKQEFKNLPHGGTEKEEGKKKNPGTDAGQTAVPSAAQIHCTVMCK